MNHQGTKRLETDRLILRRFELSDASDVYNNYASNDNVTKFLTWPSHKSVEVSKSYLEYVVSTYYNLNVYQWAIELKSNNEVVGSISVVKIDEENETFEIGYVLGESYWGLGIMPEAFEKIIKFFKDEVGVRKISARHDVNNPNSGRVMQKVGMHFVGKSKGSNNNQNGCITHIYELVL